MIWINDISQLWVNRKKDSEPCYCEYLVYPNDIMLQGLLHTNVSSGLTATIYIYDTNGNQLEDATAYFSFYSGINPKGGKYFNVTCNAFSPAMCLHKCYILRVTVKDADDIVWFDSFTEQYCQTDCCDIPRGIGIGGDGTDCPVYLNYLQKIYLYDQISDTLTHLVSGGLGYTDIAIIGDKLYARDQYGGIDVYTITGNTLTYFNKITGLPIGSSLGSDATHLYFDDGNTIKKFNPNNPALPAVTVVSSLPTAQGDIYVYADGTVMVSVDNPNTQLQFWLNNTLVDSVNIVDSSSNPIDNLYGLFYHNNVLHGMTDYGFIYSIDLDTGVGTLVSSAPNTITNNNRWNGAGQSFICGVVETNTPDADVVPMTRCGQFPIIQIKSTFECIDNETGYYYGLTDNVISGNPTFSYVNVFNIPATIKRTPRTINKVTAYNCKVQRSESFRPYELKGQGVDALLPDWKLNELENLLHGNKIEINDFGYLGNREYIYDGGEIGEKVHKRIDLFRITIPLRDCAVRTDFGCGSCAKDETVNTFVVPNGVTGNKFFTENKILVGGFSEIKGYYAGLGYRVADISDNYPNSFGAFTVTGKGVIPTFYADYTYQRNMVIGSAYPVPDSSGYASPFVWNYATSEALVFSSFVWNFSNSIDTVPMTVGIIGINDWITSGTSIVTDTSGNLTLKARNPTILPLSYTGVLGGKSYTGNGTDTQTFTELEGKTLLTVSMGGQDYNADYFTQTNTTVELTGMDFIDTVVLVWEEGIGGTPIDALNAISGKSFTGNGLNSQTFAELNNKTVLSISMGGQDYTSDYFTQTGNSIEWTDNMMTFTGTITLIWISNDGNALNAPRLANMPIGIIEVLGRPLTEQVIEVGVDKYITISTNGIIHYTGEPNSVDVNGAHISLNNIIYAKN